MTVTDFIAGFALFVASIDFYLHVREWRAKRPRLRISGTSTKSFFLSYGDKSDKLCIIAFVTIENLSELPISLASAEITQLRSKEKAIANPGSPAVDYGYGLQVRLNGNFVPVPILADTNLLTIGAVPGYGVERGLLFFPIDTAFPEKEALHVIKIITPRGKFKSEKLLISPPPVWAR